MAFAEWLRDAMRAEDVTQAELARRTKASTGLVSLWYWGKKTPSTRYIPKIASALGRTEQQLLSAIEGRDSTINANVDAHTRAVITRLFGLPVDFSDAEAELVRDLVGTIRDWQKRMLQREDVLAEYARGPRTLSEDEDQPASGAS